MGIDHLSLGGTNLFEGTNFLWQCFSVEHQKTKEFRAIWGPLNPRISSTSRENCKKCKTLSQAGYNVLMNIIAQFFTPSILQKATPFDLNICGHKERYLETASQRLKHGRSLGKQLIFCINR